MNDADLSPLHAMLVKLGRERHSKRLNRVANHPSVKPFVHGPLEGELDFSAVVQDASNVLLMGQHGGILFHHISPGIYEAHTMVLPEGRGQWALDMAQAAMHWMFTRSDAMELITRVPRGNLMARALTKAIAARTGGAFQFTAPNNWIVAAKPVPADFWSVTIQNWSVNAPGLVERGQWVADIVAQTGLALTAKPDPQALRQHGLAFEMFLNGQVWKAAILLSRWARLAGHGIATVMSERPVAIQFSGGTVVIRDHGGFYVAGPDDAEGAALH